MKFHTYLPCEQLRPYVKAMVISESDDERTYKVLPEQGLVIGFQYKGKLARMEGGQLMPLATAGITGLSDRYRIFKNTAETGTVLVYFKEGGAASFFNQPIHELFRESISLDNLILRSELLLLEEQLAEAKTDNQRIGTIEKFLISKLNPEKHDRLVAEALALINQTNGNIRINELTKHLCISLSPLEKRFRKVVGASPKKFASIVRFKYLLQSQSTATSLTDLGYSAGYYDQAHFIKEFKRFTGQTPESYLSKRSSPNSGDSAA